MSAPAITATRLAWLRHLAAHGPTPWARMPLKVNTRSGVSNQTWAPMRDAGWITAEFKAPDFRRRPDHWFTITDAGRAVLAPFTAARAAAGMQP